MADEAGNHGPVTLVVGYLDVGAAKDVRAYVRGFIERRFEARDESYYAVARFDDGYLWEAQEGGPGKSFLPAVVSVLKEDPEARIWLPSGPRALEVMMRDGRPLGLMLPSEQVEAARRNGCEGKQVAASGRMSRFRTKGHVLFGFGCAVFLGGVAVLGAAAIQTSSGPVVQDPPRPPAIAEMPHRHWADATRLVSQGGYVGKLELVNGKWSAVPKRLASGNGAAAPPQVRPYPSASSAAVVVPSAPHPARNGGKR